VTYGPALPPRRAAVAHDPEWDAGPIAVAEGKALPSFAPIEIPIDASLVLTADVPPQIELLLASGT
jgi:hypothetical protein